MYLFSSSRNTCQIGLHLSESIKNKKYPFNLCLVGLPTPSSARLRYPKVSVWLALHCFLGTLLVTSFTTSFFSLCLILGLMFLLHVNSAMLADLSRLPQDLMFTREEVRSCVASPRKRFSGKNVAIRVSLTLRARHFSELFASMLFMTTDARALIYHPYL